MTDRIVLHPGFSKTATTLLQERVFARLPGVCNLGKPGFGHDRGVVDRASWKDCLSRLRDAGPRRFPMDAMRDAWLRARQSAGGRDEAILISHEGLTTNLFASSWFRRKPTLRAKGVFVHVLLYEELVSDPKAFASRFARACGIDEPTTVAAFDGLLEHRVKSRDQVRQIENRHDRIEVPERLPEPLALRVRDHCRPGNRSLEERFGIDLAAHGYAT